MYTSHIITVKNIEVNDIKQYSSIRAASRELKVNHATLLNYIDKNKLFKDKHIINRNKINNIKNKNKNKIINKKKKIIYTINK